MHVSPLRCHPTVGAAIMRHKLLTAQVIVCVCVCWHADDDVRLARRIQRDVQERGRDVTGVLEQYQRFVKPAFDNFVAPSRR